MTRDRTIAMCVKFANGIRQYFRSLRVAASRCHLHQRACSIRALQQERILLRLVKTHRALAIEIPQQRGRISLIAGRLHDLQHGGSALIFYR